MTEEITYEQACAWPELAHPIQQAHLWTPEKLYRWQIEVLQAATEVHSRVIFSTPNESGKTSLILKLFLLSGMLAFPGAMCFATSGSERQLKEQLFEQHIVPSVEKLSGWSVRKGDMKVTAPNGSTLLCYVAKDALRVEGFHGYWDRKEDGTPFYRPCLYALDESKTIHDEVHKAVRRINPDFMLVCSTPGLRSGFFYEGVNPDQLKTN